MNIDTQNQTIITTNKIIITNNIDGEISFLKDILPQHFIRIITNDEKDEKPNGDEAGEKFYAEFKMDQSRKAIKEAYLASSDTKYIILAAKQFNTYAQNSLLKVLEEPPKNVIFILITQSKSTLLPTIHSRMQCEIKGDKSRLEPSKFDFDKLDLKSAYDFLHSNQRISKSDAKELIESLYLSLLRSNKKPTQKHLDNFSRALKLIELNTRPVNILSSLFLSLLLRD